MTRVLEKAEGVLGNENAMQEEVDEVYSELVRAFVNLRLKPNKSGLFNTALAFAITSSTAFNDTAV